MESSFARKSAQTGRILRLVPRDVQRDGRRRANQFENRGAILEFFVDIARLSRDGKTSETRPTGSDTPRRNGDAQRLRLSGEIFDVDIFPMQLFCEVIVVFS